MPVLVAVDARIRIELPQKPVLPLGHAEAVVQRRRPPTRERLPPRPGANAVDPHLERLPRTRAADGDRPYEG